ncbi:4Fe-4S binding protein [Runella zeae]|uniref:4Fe-4S binding protein n=2 Tax=Runella zeae TaxID=94255 RepID=UPI000428011F|nr:4Fe-4S binding protein [Runella zeae]
MKTYFQHISEGIRTTLAGMKLTFKHLWDARHRRSQNNIREDDYFNESNGMVTLQYPFESMPIPDNGRYRLHNEMDDCIVCDKCAKVCPVDCIDIEPIKATSEIGKASDGSPIRLYAAKFDIDMAKCCYCGLCTTVCPTECLTMTKTFDYSEFDVKDMNYHYSNLTPEQAEEKKSLYEQFVREKEELKKQSATAKVTSVEDETAKPKPAFRPSPKPTLPTTESKTTEETNEIAPAATPRPKPAFVPKKSVPETSVEDSDATPQAAPKPKPVFVPKKTTSENTVEDSDATPQAAPKPKPVFVPKKTTSENTVENSDAKPQAAPKPKPVFVPKKTTSENTVENSDATPQATPKPKPIFVPKKPETETKSTENQEASSLEAVNKNTDSEPEKPRSKPVFKPTMKPKKEE